MACIPLVGGGNPLTEADAAAKLRRLVATATLVWGGVYGERGDPSRGRGRRSGIKGFLRKGDPMSSMEQSGRKFAAELALLRAVLGVVVGTLAFVAGAALIPDGW